ncbi:MAG: Gamma-glutamyl phosphate reductase [Planctomycetes bacterium ADurb.Bin412]|nr:MAG: Gamma-glutamyl phosphate reductase [Planctomycetes bacterium ADurb.Bin412]
MIQEIAFKARQASIRTAALSAEEKNCALAAIAGALRQQEKRIVAANQEDLAQAQKDHLNPALLKRLKFDGAKLKGAIEGIESLITLADPVGRTLSARQLDNGLELYQVSAPIGVLGIIFESRPDALVQISTLALKSGNAVLLKGGSEAVHTNRALAEVIIEASEGAGLPEGWMALLETRADVNAMLALEGYIDLMIPRGSNAFVKYIMDHTRIPVLGHADGICHVFIDRAADLEKAVRIAYDSKCQYPAVCNAMETLLVDQAIAGEFLPRIKAEYEKAGVELRGDSRTQNIIEVKAADEQDWKTEYNDLILSIRVVDGLEAAIDHINTYSSHHTDAIVTEDSQAARQFLNRVDSADVFWNCSTRFADGFRYGLGAEVGISTNKIHARGPVGLEGLVIYKWKLLGRGQIVAEYSGPQAKPFTHKEMNKPCPL